MDLFYRVLLQQIHLKTIKTFTGPSAIENTVYTAFLTGFQAFSVNCFVKQQCIVCEEDKGIK